MSDPRPNILLITDDQHRWDFYGDTGVVPTLRTPNMDRLRADGATLTNAYANCPICMPARFNWCYGLYASQASDGLMANRWHWPDDLPSMPQALQRAGYHTAMVGKLHSHAGLESYDVTAHEDQTRARGFDDVLEVSGKSLVTWYDCRWTRHLESRGLLQRYKDDLRYRNIQLGGCERYEPSFLETPDTMDGFIGNQACQWLGDHRGEQPFFLHASFCGPHFPLDPPREFFDKYRPQDMPAPVGVTDPAAIRQWQEHRALYCGLIELVDQQIGRLLDVLAARGLADTTAVLFTTDHGDMIGDLGLNHKGIWPDPSCRTPIMVRMPGLVQPATRLTGMVEAVDLPCTVLDIAGCGPDASVHLPRTPGRSFWPYVTGQSPTFRPWAYSECGGRRAWRMIVEDRWKYVFHTQGRDCLYDRIADPLDQTDLADSPAAAHHLARLRRQMIQSLTNCVAPDRATGDQAGAR